MLELNRPGKIINVASIISFIGGAQISTYAATKGGVLQMTKALSNEWAGKGIQVNCICPGYVENSTDLLIEGTNETSSRYCATPLTVEYTSDKVKNEYVMQGTPAGRWGLPEDFRGVVVFLASSANNFVTGTSIVVDGGLIAK
jgi:2-deoxy-D-gluconate 3-dehydrogenase